MANALQQTKGYFELSGIVSGVKRNDYYSEKMTNTANSKLRKSVKFAIQTGPNNKVFVTLSGMPMDKVYFSKKAEVKGEKSVTKPVDWDKRKSFNEDGYKLIGVNVGLVKKLDKEGKEINDNQRLVAYDAVDYVKEHLRDDMSVFVRGHMEYSRFEDKNIKQFVIDQISLCHAIDFSKEDFKELSAWEQSIAFRAIEKDESEPDKNIVTGSIITYNNIVDTDFVLRNSKLAQTFKKNLRPFNRVKIFGDLIGNVKEIVAEEEDDGWGEPNKLDSTGGYYKEMLIVGADKSSVDTELYSEAIFEEFLRSKKEFGETSNNNTDDDDDDDWTV